MDVSKILAELREERAQIEEAILSLERLASGRGKRRGRPPAWMSETTPAKRRGRPPGSKNKVAAASLLANGAKLKTQASGNDLVIEVPAKALDPIATVIKLQVKGPVESAAALNGKMKSGALD